MNDKNHTFKIYYDGRLDYRATYTPIIKQKVSRAIDKIDFFIVNSRWPRKGEL